MRKILLATTALVGVVLTGAASAAPASPISLNVGGYDDFVAGIDQAEQLPGVRAATARISKTSSSSASMRLARLQTALNMAPISAFGTVLKWATYGEAAALGVTLNSGYVWMSGAFGKALFGDEHGATDLFVYAPTVGEGQVDGRFRDFVDAHTLAYMQASGIDNTEHSTKITYYTPKVGNDSNKVQLGISYIPNMYNYGQSTVLTQSNSTVTGDANSPYQDVVKGAVAYTGSFRPVDIALSADIIEGDSGTTAFNGTTLGAGGQAPLLAGSNFKAQDFVSWGVGGQLGFSGATVGVSYVDLGRL